MLKYLRIAFPAAALLLFAADATAICLAGHVYEVYVGDKASDATCTYDSIQDALSATYTCATTIRVTRMHTYTTQHLTLNGTTKPLTLQGEADGVTCYQLSHCLPLGGCHTATTQPLVTIDGSNTAGSVLTITGNSTLTLRDLTITRGAADASAAGGGILFNGTGALALDTTTVSLNYAGYGGGIDVNGNGGAATLTLDANSLVILNTAEHDGGGIRLTGQARLFALQPYTYIFENHADNGYGGGIEVVGPAQADIGSPGYNGAPVIDSNTAAYGGGIGMDAAPDNADVKVRIFSTDAHAPVSVSKNSASHTGGGIWMHPYISGISNTVVNPYFCAFDFRIDKNVAQEGTAIYADTDSSVGNGSVGGIVRLNSDDGFSTCNTPESMASLGAVHCAPGVTCNTLDENVAKDSASSPKPGSVILIQDTGGLTGARFAMRGNTGQHAIRSLDGGVTLDTCLIADNTLTAEMLRFENDGTAAGFGSIDGCTIVNNSDEGAPVIYSAYQLSLTDSIIDELSINTVNYVGPGGGLTASNVLATETATLPASASIDQGEPTYVDAANHDYHLQPTSAGVDFAQAKGGVDLDGNPRDVDLAPITDNFGPRDIGAYERQNMFQCGTSDSVFCNGYEYSW